jgi:dTDP-4-dehydrorhamnose 3,5-epimerase
LKIENLGIDGVKLIHLDRHNDERGFFVEAFNQERFKEEGLPFHFVQDNHSRSHPGILRGLHYQLKPGQGKLVRVIRGTIWDVVVDMRTPSPTFGKHVSVVLNGDDSSLLWVPSGLAHGFYVLGDEPADVCYKVDSEYCAKTESGILWSDLDLKINWPNLNPVLSEKDKKLPTFAEYKAK